MAELARMYVLDMIYFKLQLLQHANVSLQYPFLPIIKLRPFNLECIQTALVR